MNGGRWRKHKDGDHSECLVKNCDALSDASHDRSPQDRTGRDGNNPPHDNALTSDEDMLVEYRETWGDIPD